MYTILLCFSNHWTLEIQEIILEKKNLIYNPFQGSCQLNEANKDGDNVQLTVWTNTNVLLKLSRDC